MRIIADDLRWILTEMRDHGLEAVAFVFIFNFVQIDTVFISERVKDIHMLNSVFSSLFVAVN